MAGYTDLPIIIIPPKVTVMKPANFCFQTLHHTKVKKSHH